MVKPARILLVDGAMGASRSGALARSDYADRTIKKLAEKAGVGLDRHILIEEINSGKDGIGDTIGKKTKEYDGVIIGPAGMVHTIQDEYVFGMTKDGRKLKSGDITGITMEIIGRCDSEGIPVLGICSGSQIIARYAGDAVSELPRKESGFMTIWLTAAGGEHWLFNGLGPGIKVAEAHMFGVVEPEHLSILAKSGLCTQAFTIEGKDIVGVQFHPEADGSLWAGGGITGFIDAMKRKARGIVSSFAGKDGEAEAFETGATIMCNFFSHCAAQR